MSPWPAGDALWHDLLSQYLVSHQSAGRKSVRLASPCPPPRRSCTSSLGGFSSRWRMHITMCLLVGLLYGAMLPLFPNPPDSAGWNHRPADLDRTALPCPGLCEPCSMDEINWWWFAASQFAFGIVAGLVVARQNKVWTSENVPFALRAGIEAPGIHARTRRCRRMSKR